jgi:hypothetical protein
MISYKFIKDVLIIFPNGSKNISEITQIIEKIRPSNHVIIWQPWEESDAMFYEYLKHDYTSDPNHSEDVSNFENTLTKYDIKCFLLVGCDFSEVYSNLNTNPIKNFEVLFWPTALLHYTFYGMTEYYGKKPIELFDSNKLIKKLYLNLNNHSRVHRAEFMDYLCKFGLFDYGVNTWTHVEENWPYQYFKARKLTLDKNWDGDKPHKVYSYELLNVDNLIDIVTETAPILGPIDANFKNSEFIFHTEKTYRSILFGKPFLVLGNRGQNKNLQKYGLNLYDSIFKYHFDDSDSLDFRCLGIIDNLFQVKDKNYNEVKDFVSAIAWSNIITLTNIVHNDLYIPDKLKVLIKENKEAYGILLKDFDFGYCDAFEIDYNWSLTKNIFKEIYENS